MKNTYIDNQLKSLLSQTGSSRELYLKASAIEQWRLDKTPVSCWTCEHFKDGYCNVFKDEVPKEFQLDGCEQWAIDIPF